VGIEDSLFGVMKEHGEQWGKEFSEFLSCLNSSGNGVCWWAHVSTAKNLLSSPLGDRFFQVKAACHLIRKCNDDVIHVVGATHGQKVAIAAEFPEFNVEYIAWRWKEVLSNSFHLFKGVFGLLCRVIYSFLDVLRHGSCKEKEKEKVDVAVFTYMDASGGSKGDSFFGDLFDYVKNHKERKSLIYLTYFHSSYNKAIKKRIGEDSEGIYYLMKTCLYFFSTLLDSYIGQCSIIVVF